MTKEFVKTTIGCQVLFFMGMILVCLDIINVDLGGFKLKLAYVAFALYLVLFAFWFGLDIDRKNLTAGLILLAGFFPSVLLTTSALTSVAFYAGTIMCVVIMLTFARMTYVIGERVVDLLVIFYRFSVMVTLAFVLTGFQERGHFLFYEASYYAIALIPYLCIVFYRLVNHTGNRTGVLDLGFIALAVVLSASVSLVLWIAISFVVIYLRSGRARLSYIFVAAGAAVVLLYLAVQYNERAQAIADKAAAVAENPADFFDLLIFVAGNRVQRVLVAYEAFLEHPVFGVGLGALKSFATANFNSGMFEIDGTSADDFSADMNATNVYLELAAEGGVVALLSFCFVLAYVASRVSGVMCARPLQIAFFVTMTTLLIESSYLRTYVWALYGVLIGLGALESTTKTAALHSRQGKATGITRSSAAAVANPTHQT